MAPGIAKLVLLLTVYNGWLAGIDGNPDARRLYENLLSERSGYNKLIRPVGNNTDRLTVKLGLRLSQLIDVVSVTFTDYTDI